MKFRHLSFCWLLCGSVAGAGCAGLNWSGNDLDSLLSDQAKVSPRPFPTATPVPANAQTAPQPTRQSAKPVLAAEKQPVDSSPTGSGVAAQPSPPAFTPRGQVKNEALKPPPTLDQLRRDPAVGNNLSKLPAGRVAFAPPANLDPNAATTAAAAAPAAAPPAVASNAATVDESPAPPANSHAAREERRLETEESERVLAAITAMIGEETPSVFQMEEVTFPKPPAPTAKKPVPVIRRASAEEEERPTSPVKPSREPKNIKTEPPASEAEKPAEPDAEELAAELETRRAEMIDTLEQLIRKSKGKTSKEELARWEQELRLLYLSADRLDDATQKIESLPDAPREAFKHLAFALSQMMPREDDRRPSHRYARTMRALREASQELSSAGRLELKNLAFCESVEQFGWYSEFKRREFTAGQQMILYVEVDNVTSERKGPQQFETELAGSYQIFNAANQLVGERTLPLDKENCRNWRRDYFLAYRIYLPDELATGGYRLELTIEDLKAKSSVGGKKLGEGILEFTVK